MNNLNWLVATLGAIDLTAIAALIVTIAKLRSTVRMGEAEADKASAQADKETVLAMREAYDAMKDALAEVRTSNDRFLTVHENDEQTIASKNESITTLREENAALKMLICKHAACPFREPPMGRGPLWWEQHKTDEVLTDTDSVGVIGRRFGYYVKRLPVKSEEVRSNGDD